MNVQYVLKSNCSMLLHTFIIRLQEVIGLLIVLYPRIFTSYFIIPEYFLIFSEVLELRSTFILPSFYCLWDYVQVQPVQALPSKVGYTFQNLPRSPFFKPYQLPSGFLGDLPRASTVSSFACFCSSALPSSIQSPCFLSMTCKSSMHRRS
jgi:hypothetical protein